MMSLLFVVAALFQENLCLSTRQTAGPAGDSLILRFLETAAVVGESFGGQKWLPGPRPCTFTAKNLSRRRRRELRPSFRPATPVGVIFGRRGTLRRAWQGVSSVVQ